MPGSDVLQKHVAEQGRFSRARLADNVDVAARVRHTDAKVWCLVVILVVT